MSGDRQYSSTDVTERRQNQNLRAFRMRYIYYEGTLGESVPQRSMIQILHLEDNDRDSELVARALSRSGLQTHIEVVRDRSGFLQRIENGSYDVILSDNTLPGFEGTRALALARQRHPGIPFIFVSAFRNVAEAEHKKLTTGATDCLSKSELERLGNAVNAALAKVPEPVVDAAYVRGMEQLVGVVQELSLARDLERIMAIVRHAARELTGADGATFVLRDGDQCHYADEEAIAPLWRGLRFPLSACISGWAMLEKKAAVIEDIYADARIPADAYRPTFVKSLAMVPIRVLDPIGAIGTYWATRRQPLPHEVKLLQALADSTSIAMENVQLYDGLEQKVQERTSRLKSLNDELEAFSHSVSHDLRAPLRHIKSYLEEIQDDSANVFSGTSRRHLAVVSDAARRMETLIRELLEFSRAGSAELSRQTVNMNDLVAEVRGELEPETKGRDVEWDVAELPEASGNRELLKQVWTNLLSNAIKYSRKKTRAHIEVRGVAEGIEWHYSVRDNGAGFDMSYAAKLFGTFQRLHRADEFEGTGIGLANVRRIVGRHGGRVWAESEVGQGATFSFTIPK